MFDLTDIDMTMDRDAVDALLSNTILGIRIRNFLSLSETEEIHKRILDIGLEDYIGDTKGGSAERKGKIGPNLFRFRHDVAEYFSRIEEFEASSKPKLLAGIDVPGRFQAVVQRSLPTNASFRRGFSSSMGKSLSDCTVRSLPSAPPHRDWIKGEMPDFDAVSAITDQFAWNVYITTGHSGGETAIYDKGEQVSAGDHNPPLMVFQPKAGDLVMFRTRNLHEVRPTDGNRFTVSGFWGPRADGDFQYWV